MKSHVGHSEILLRASYGVSLEIFLVEEPLSWIFKDGGCVESSVIGQEWKQGHQLKAIVVI